MTTISHFEQNIIVLRIVHTLKHFGVNEYLWFNIDVCFIIQNYIWALENAKVAYIAQL